MDRNTALEEIKDLDMGKRSLELVSRHIAVRFGGEDQRDMRFMIEKMLWQMPLQSLAVMSCGTLTLPMIDGLVSCAERETLF